MLRNNGPTKNDLYQAAQLKGTKISTKHTCTKRVTKNYYTLRSVRISTKGFAWTLSTE